MSARTIDALILGSTISCCWLAAYPDIDVPGSVEGFAGPAGAIILLPPPIYAIHKVPALAPFRGRLGNAFATAIGAFTVSAISYGLFG